MRVERDVPAPDARELRAAGLAALAEAGVAYLPLHLILTEARAIAFDVGTLAAPFLVAYVAGTLLACRFRASRSLATGALLVALLTGLYLGRGDLNRSVFTVVVSLLVGLRVVSLGVRDWRAPIDSELGWGAVALGIESILSGGSQPQWRPLLAIFVPMFFAAALASRASTVWTGAGASDLDERVRVAWIRRALVTTGGLLVAMVTAVMLGVRGGVFDRVGGWLAPVANAAASFLVFLLAQAARPVFWLVDRLGIDPEAFRRFLEDLRERGLARRAEEELERPGPSLWQRVLAFLAFAGAAYALYRVLRRFRPRLAPEERPAPEGTATATTLPVEEAAPPRRSSLRRELPVDAVRRMYAEALIALRARELSKEPSLTPGEFAPVVMDAFPEVGEGFRQLTRAYEDVRYGDLRPDRETLSGLEASHRRVLAVLRAAP
ncbi:MAG TPA: DUF4129 domain-containing protein [Actinomycetota bacterium]